MPLHKPARGRQARVRRRTARLYGSLGNRSARLAKFMPITIDVRVFVADSTPFPASVDATFQREKREEVENLFRQHADLWSRETRHWSSVTKMTMHPSYRRIMGMGPDVLPLLFRELRKRPDHWFVALSAITGHDPAPPSSTFQQAVDAWLSWGIQHGFFK
jgi:hypothetical protein